LQSKQNSKFAFFREKQHSNVRSQLQIFDSAQIPAAQLQNHHQHNLMVKKFSGLVDFSGKYRQFSDPPNAKISTFQQTALNGYDTTQPVDLPSSSN
jgi:hypothetical protein